MIPIFAALLLTGAAEAFAQGKPEATIRITRQSDLAFGTLIAGPSGGTVTVTPEGIRTDQGVFAIPGAFNAARFQVEASLPKKYMILLPSTATLTREGGGASMTVDAFASNPAVKGQVDMPAKTGELLVGATLHVAPGQMPGSYRGSYFVTVTLFD